MGDCLSGHRCKFELHKDSLIVSLSENNSPQSFKAKLNRTLGRLKRKKESLREIEQRNRIWYYFCIHPLR